MKPIVILGVFVADLTFRNDRMPVTGQTLIGKSFKLGPGGKGSNQVIAARRAGADVYFIAMLGKDPFGQMALDLYADEGVKTDYVFQTAEKDTGAADIMVNDLTGDNAIILVNRESMRRNGVPINHGSTRKRHADTVKIFPATTRC